MTKDDTKPTRAKLSPRALEGARAFLSALFMGARTAQIHDPSNAAFAKAVDHVFDTALTLHRITGGFSVKFVEDSAYLDGIRLRFDASAFAAMRSLRNILESEGLGGVEMAAQPTRASVEKLLYVFTRSGAGRAITKEDLAAAHIGIVGVQRLADGSEAYTVDRRVFAVQSYGKLILALREQFERASATAEVDWASSSAPPRLRVVRVIQDFVELTTDRADFVLRLQQNRTGAALEELYGVNSCLLSLALGAALGLSRQSLVDLAVGTLFHHVGSYVLRESAESALSRRSVVTSLATLLADCGVGRSTSIRGLVVAECLRTGLGAEEQHLFSRIARVATAYQQLVTGYGVPKRRSALDALSTLGRNDEFDQRIVDLLYNVLAAYPEGTEVALASGRAARIVTQLGGSRWDRPIVRLETDDDNLDLMSKDGDRFVDRITATKKFVGLSPAPERTLDDLMPPFTLSAAALIELDTEGLEDLADVLEDEFDDDLPPLALSALGPSMLEGDPDG